MEVIVNIRLDELFAHPKQKEVYGDESIDNAMLESIEARGIITPLIVGAWNADLEGHIIVSGHRRKIHAQELGLETVPCIERKYQNEDEMDLDFLLSNQNREKTIKQRVNEFISYKQKLSQIGKLRMSKGLSKEESILDESLLTFVKALEISPEKPLNTIEIIEKATGFSERKQRYATVVFDPEYRANKINYLYELALKNGKKFDRDAADKQLYELEKAVTDGDKTLHSAFEEINAAIKQFEDSLKSEPKAKKLKMVKEEKPKSKKLNTSLLKIKEIQKTNRDDLFVTEDTDSIVFAFKGRLFEIDLTQLSNELNSLSVAV